MILASPRNQAADLLTTFSNVAGLSRSAGSVRNALPHFVSEFVDADYITALRNMGATLQVSEANLADLTEQDLPCLLLARSLPATLVLEANQDKRLVLTAGDETPKWISASQTSGMIVRIAPLDDAPNLTATEGILEATKGFRGIVVGLLAASLFTNLVALASPLLIMVIYDQIIPTKSIDTIFAFAIGISVVLILDVSLRAVRAMAIAHMGSLVEKELGLALFRKLSRLPLSNLERSGIHEQIARLRQFESFRDLFSGSIFTTFLDLPFVLIFLAVLFYLAPQVGLLLVGVILIFAIASFVSLAVQQALGERTSAAKSEQQQLFFEISKQVVSIQRLGAEGYWSTRIDKATEKVAALVARSKRVQLIAQTFGQSLMMAAGTGAIAFGAASALSGDVTIGALIALMTLVWRVLGPVQALFSSISQVKGFVLGLKQIKRVLSLEDESAETVTAGPVRKFSGRIDLKNVSHRFDPTQEPVLSGVSLSVKPGEITMFCGLSGSGRSTLFHLINRLYTPTAGAIYFDDIDYRQIAVDDLRRSVTAERQYTDFFHGTIKQNFELANPIVTSDDIDVVLRALGLDHYIDALPEGIETRLDEKFQQKMSKSLSKGLGLARCLLRDSSIYLLDEPCSGLDANHEHKFLTCLTALKGKRTILMTSDRPSHWELADNLVFLDRGKVLVNEPRATALPKVQALYRQMESE